MKRLKKWVASLLLCSALTNSFLLVTAETESTSDQVSEQNESDNVLATYDFETPEALLAELATLPSRVLHGIQIMFAVTQDEYAVSSRIYSRDNQLNYIVSTGPGVLAMSTLVEMDDEGNVTRTFVPASELMTFSAEALNDNPEIYTGTAVETFYVYAQEHHEELSNQLIEDTELSGLHQVQVQEAKNLEAFIVNVFKEWLTQENKEPEIQEVEGLGTLYGYEITAEDSIALGEIAASLAGEDETLLLFVEVFNSGYVGTLGFSLDLGNVALSLQSPDQLTVFEYFMSLNGSELVDVESQEIVTGQEFSENVGITISDLLNTSAFEETVEDELSEVVEEGE